MRRRTSSMWSTASAGRSTSTARRSSRARRRRGISRSRQSSATYNARMRDWLTTALNGNAIRVVAEPGQFRPRAVRGCGDQPGGVPGAVGRGADRARDRRLRYRERAPHFDRTGGRDAPAGRGAQDFRRAGSAHLMFEKLALIGIGLIGSSIARAARQKGLVEDDRDLDAAQARRWTRRRRWVSATPTRSTRPRR